jgi:hypothetical protein
MRSDEKERDREHRESGESESGEDASDPAAVELESSSP